MPTTPLADGEVGKCGAPVSSLADMETLFDGIPLDQVTVSMTINSPAAVDLGHVPGGRREAGRGSHAHLRHAAERHPEGIHRAEGIHLSAAPVHAAGHRYHRIRARSTRRASIPFRSAAITSAKPARPRCRNWRSPCATASNTSTGRWSAASPSTISRRASASSSTRTTIFSKRSPNTAPPANSGRT